MSDKITREHLERAAYIYVRQSSAQQVRRHKESQRQQYGLRDLAGRMGFHQVVTIDDDLGKSGGGYQERPGFSRLLTAVCQGAVGAVFALEATRLARNNRDWHHLIDLCALTGTLVVDGEGVYDPRLLNDRLLLGLKGNMAEFELGLIRQRAQEARAQLIRRGAVLWEPPVGYVRTEDYKVEKIPDRQVQEAIAGVFRRFEQLGSARQVLLWYRQEEVLLPRVRPATAGREIEWAAPTNGRILKILQNPCYAGAFAYGRTRTKTVVHNGRGQKSQGHRLPLEQWQELILEHHDGYISWLQFLQNQKVLAQNTAMRGDAQSGAAKSGPALLAGLLRCARCGRKFHVGYSGQGGRVPRYHCHGANVNHGGAPCLSVGGVKLDRSVCQEVLKALDHLSVEAALQATRCLEQQADEKRRMLELALEKARYEVHRARRQYDAVDPENRLVASELESRWNKALADLQRLEQQLAELPQPQPSLTAQQRQRLMELGEDVSQLWNHPHAPVALKKRILRTVLEEIVLDVSEESSEIVLQLHWAGGVHTQLRTPKNKSGRHRHCIDEEVVNVVRDLAKVCRDQATASILNRLNLKTGAGKTWTECRVRSLRHTHGIAPCPPETQRAWITLEQAAASMDVSKSVIRRLIQTKILPASQTIRCAPWIIQRDDLQLPHVQEAIQAVHAGQRRPRTDARQQQLTLNS